MDEDVPEHLREEARSVEAEIRAAFKGVTREGGISWSGADVANWFGTAEEIAEAAKLDTESRWEELVDDPAWREEVACGRFCFLDPIGYRYYIAPAMIRCTRRGGGEFTAHALIIKDGYVRESVGLISPAEARAIARFIRLMIAMHAAVDDKIYGPDWTTAYKSHWKQFDTGTPLP